MNVEKNVETAKQNTIQQENGRFFVRSAKECAYLAVFVALTIGAQVAFAALPGVEIVTLLFVAYSFVFGVRRGALSATAFSLLRQFVFAFSGPTLVLYLVYYNLLAAVFGALGHIVKRPLVCLWWLTAVACVCTVSFTLLDDVITPWWLGFSDRAWRAYFYASLSVMLSQGICTAVTIFVLFYPLQKAFRQIKKGLR